MAKKDLQTKSVLADMPPARAIVKLAVPATLALLAKAVYNLVDTAYIGMLNNDLAMAGVGVTAPLLLIMVSIENIFAAGLPQSDEIIAAYGIVQRLVLIDCYIVMGFMQGYQPVASYAFGAREEDRFHQSVRFALKGSLMITILVEIIYILLSGELIFLFNHNPVIVDYGRRLLISQLVLYPAFGLCYMMTITYQTILVCLFSVKSMKATASRAMGEARE